MQQCIDSTFNIVVNRSNLFNQEESKIMKRVITSKSTTAAIETARDAAYDVLDQLHSMGVSDDTIVDHMVRWFDANDVESCLLDLKDEIEY